VVTETKLVGVDVGGTFTDLVLVDETTGEVRIAKVPTTRNQADGVLAALERAGAAPGELRTIVHGSTVATNALLERRGARTGLITTRGFRDLLELGRRTRPTPYGLKGSFEPLIPRDLRIEVGERLDAEGAVITPLADDDVREAARMLRARGVDSLVIHFLHSYRNDQHERRATEIAAVEWPNPYITTGSALLPEHREYERGTTAAINAFVQPAIDRYLRALAGELASRGYRHELIVMQSNGGSMSVDAAVRHAVTTLMSGPAAGVQAAAYVARAAGRLNVISCDMGGTSFDVALIRDGSPTLTAEQEVGYGLPVRTPMIDIHTIGAGGGSIARVSAAGVLEVGPESAAADPGPICFGRGGEAPTISDAHLLLGRLNPEALLGVERPVALDHVRDVFARRIGRPLGLDAVAAAQAVLRVANDRMAGAIRLVSLRRGHDPRDFVLFAFGGAGPLHATALARELGIPTVLVPPRPGAASAFGCLAADARRDFVRTVNRDLARLDAGEAGAILAAQAAEGRRLLVQEGVAASAISTRHEADLQFAGQTHVLTIAVSGEALDREELLHAFQQAYWQRFAVELPEMRVQLVSLRTTVTGRRRPRPLERLFERPTDGGSPAPPRTRPVFFDDRWVETPIYSRDALAAGAEFKGPAIVEQMDGTTVVEPGDRVRVDALGNLEIAVGALEGAHNR
jgi:N-methylhydantoinase A